MRNLENLIFLVLMLVVTNIIMLGYIIGTEKETTELIEGIQEELEDAKREREIEVALMKIDVYSEMIKHIK